VQENDLALNRPVVKPAPATSEIVPSAVIEANAEFVFGTGDGSAGSWSDHPARC